MAITRVGRECENESYERLAEHLLSWRSVFIETGVCFFIL